MKTNGLIGKRQIREALLERKNNKPDWVKGSKIYGPPHKVFIGNNLVIPSTGTTFPIVINGALFFKVDHYFSGRFVISLIAKDSRGNIALKVIDNLILFATSSWDIANTGKNYIIKEKERRILINIEVDAENEAITVTGNFDVGLDKQLVISRNGIKLGKTHTLSSGCTVKGSSIGVYLSSFDNDWPGAIMGPGNITNCHFKGFPIAIKQAYSVKNSIIEESRIAFFWSFDVLKKYL